MDKPLTVGYGFAPYHAEVQLAGLRNALTAGGEFHPALKLLYVNEKYFFLQRFDSILLAGQLIHDYTSSRRNYL